ncbi:MAG TPA: amino acid synthesis family protein [Roseiflexaceae bacterium]|nr:amino acid synthesis family protein [Roseiflexaceae bacterium]HMP40538.1 amino acid synthesis family protein [Roseiflexaceae bacterium]
MITIRKFVTLTEEIFSEMGRPAEKPLRKVAVAAIFRNPYAGRYSEDLSELVNFNEPLGKIMAEQITRAMGEPIESLGKGALIGMNGDAIHGNACLLGEFANPIRAAIGGGLAWIQSNTKRTAPGGMIDIPMAHKDALYVRDHYDTITVHLPDAPHPDEIAVIIAAANRSYLNPRLGGLQADQISVRDGQR